MIKRMTFDEIRDKISQGYEPIDDLKAVMKTKLRKYIICKSIKSTTHLGINLKRYDDPYPEKYKTQNKTEKKPCFVNSCRENWFYHNSNWQQ